jgi:hypothetical protein
MPSKQPTPEDIKRETDKKLDEALSDSFPSSDPVSISEPAAKEPAPKQPR